MKIKCYEFFGCRKSKCVMFDQNEKRGCWLVEDALAYCIGIDKDSIRNRDTIFFCRNCLYYEHMQKNRPDLFVEDLSVHDRKRSRPSEKEDNK